MEKHWSRPFPVILIPVFEGYPFENSIALANQLKGVKRLLGLVRVNPGEPLSSGNLTVRAMRKMLRKTAKPHGIEERLHISVSYDPWQDLHGDIRQLKPDLVILDWETFEMCDSDTRGEVLGNLGANLAVVCGQLPRKINSSLVPLRGGPHAQLALRLTLALPAHQISSVHLVPENHPAGAVQASFRGLQRILPALPEVKYEVLPSSNPVAKILDLSAGVDLLVIGATARTDSNGRLVSTTASELVKTCPCPLVMVKSERSEPGSFVGPEAERSGSQALSILVDKWFAENTFHASEFDDLNALLALKRAQNVTVSLALPALNEEKTVGHVLSTVLKTLVDKYPLLDEVVLIDSNSSDHTREIAESLGVPVFIHQELLPQYGARAGKGEALWKSLYVTRGDIVLWIDSDIVNIHPRFVYGVLGPLLLEPDIQFVKGFYQRPLRSGRKVQSTGGGRVTELTARPLINLFYPELSGVIQPLSGEYGGRRAALEQLTFCSGYGVETSLLIDAYEKFGLKSIAQVDLLERIHHNQSLQALSKMSFVIIQTVLTRLEKRFQAPILEEINKSMKLIEYIHGEYYLDVQDLVEQDRPPMVTLPEYCEKYGLAEPAHA